MPGGDMANEPVNTSKGFTRIKISYLVGVSALGIFALAVSVSVILILASPWEAIGKFFKQPPVRYLPAPTSVQIVVVNGKTSTGNVLLDAETNSLIRETLSAIHNAVEVKVTDKRLLAEIERDMKCAEGQQLIVSDYIRYASDSSFVDTVARDRINDFICRVGNQTSKWEVFGFASEPGSDGRNQELSWKRACEVKKQLCNDPDFDCESNYDQENPEKGDKELNCGDKSVQLFGKGSAHFINGTANSRSAVIAACFGEADEAGADGNSDTTAPSCPGSG